MSEITASNAPNYGLEVLDFTSIPFNSLKKILYRIYIKKKIRAFNNQKFNKEQIISMLDSKDREDLFNEALNEGDKRYYMILPTKPFSKIRPYNIEKMLHSCPYCRSTLVNTIYGKACSNDNLPYVRMEINHYIKNHGKAAAEKDMRQPAQRFIEEYVNTGVVTCGYVVNKSDGGW